MAKLRQKKGKAGKLAAHISRAQAVRKLQVSLKDFRRLCILKGVFPREAPDKNHKNRTYYLQKDIQFLMHEPILNKFRDTKAFLKKFKKAVHRKEYHQAKSLEEGKPVYALDHIVKERYPSFADALRDLDDAISLIQLFAHLPTTEHIPQNRIDNCKRLVKEFEGYVAKSSSLRKTFLSIKGIYYQAIVEGQTITWITSYKFAQTMPMDVDYRVMLTFLEFYECLCTFVNFRLYKSLGLKYPPTLDAEADAAGANLTAVIMERVGEMDAAIPNTADKTAKASKKQKKSKRLIASLGERLKNVDEDGEGENDDDDEDMDNSGGEEEEDEEEEFADSAEVKAIQHEDDEEKLMANLFSQLKVFISREVPRESLEFVLTSGGASIGWYGAGSPFSEGEEDITHQIVDRPIQSHKYLSRDYVQPQWVYDCLNARRILPVENYLLGAPLPPHLSPFVNDEEEGYVPAQRRVLEAAGQEAKEIEMEDNSEDGEGSSDDEDEEELHQRELEAEKAGIPYSKSGEKSDTKKKRKKKDEEEEEQKELAKMMMTKKNKRLYSRMQYGIEKKKAAVEKLESKRQKLEATKKKKAK